MTASIRSARKDDGPGLYRAWQSMRKHYAGTDSRIIPAPVSEREFLTGLDETLTRPTSAAFVAEDKARVVGFVTAGIEQNLPDRLPERHATVGYFFVEPSHRRSGVGKQLYEAVAEWAEKQEGVGHIEMTVLAADAQAEPFWRGLGFTPFITRLWAPLGEADGEE